MTAISATKVELWNQRLDDTFSADNPLFATVTIQAVDTSHHGRTRLNEQPAPAENPAARDPRKVLFIGLFPPPVNGQRIVTQCMFERLDAIATVARHNVDRFRGFGPLSKLLSALAACFVLVRTRLKGFSTLYLAPHSGAGLIFSCLIVLASRCAGYTVAVHYHSYRNMGRFSWLMASFLAICGPRAIHIVLAPPMARDLQRLYRSVQNVTVVSNTTFVQPRTVARVFGRRRLRIGHLSNLSREKGIGIVLDCMRSLRARHVNVELWLAGPAEDAATRALIGDAQAEFGDRLNYLGRLDALGVARFYDAIDVFLFPSSYEHEAEPLVIVDAASAGVPVIATDRGCIDYLLGAKAGLAVAPESFLARAVEQIGTWAENPGQLAEASDRASARFLELHDQSQQQLDLLLAAIAGGAVDQGASNPGDRQSPAKSASP